MADTYKKLYQGQPGITATLVYTAPAGTGAIIKHWTAVNTTSGAVTLQLFRNGSAATNAITPVMSIPPLGMIECDETDSFEATGTIQAIAGSAAAVTLTISGDETS